MSVEAVSVPKSRWKVLRRIAGALAIALLVALGWTLLWRLAARQSERIIDAWIVRERSIGRNWSCPDRKVQGFPFAIEISCAKPAFDGLIFGEHFAGGLNGFNATAVVYHPSAVRIALASPFSVRSDDRRTALDLTWDDLDVVLDGLPQNIWRVRIKGDRLSLRGNFENAGLVMGAAGHLSADAAARPDQTDSAYDFTLAVGDAGLPDLDRLLGVSLPTQISAQGTLTKARFDPGLDVTQNVDNWRAAGGRLDIVDANLSHGDIKFDAHGSLSLDNAHRLEGKLDTKSRGLEPMLLRLGVNPTLVSAGALLSSFITGDLPSNQKNETADLVVSIGFDDGRISIGPVKTSAHVPPLY
ncbi:MAG TPA: DUF2125 domain-containing protein [Methylovirgula sp.]|nr:DUF2125 domain-containing protein [Methylovirgula sp.]